MNPIQLAVRSDNLKSFRSYCETSASLDKLYLMLTADGKTLLHLAAYYEASSVCTFILANITSHEDQLAILTRQDVAGNTALHYAAWNGNQEITQRIISSLPNTEDMSRLVNVSNQEGKTPLHFASSGGNTSVAEILLKSGADPNKCDSVCSETALHAAAVAGNSSLVKLLIESGSVAKQQNSFQNTPLHRAIRFVQTSKAGDDVIKELLKASITSDLELTDKVGRTALLLAAHYGTVRTVSLLLQHGTNPTSVDAAGCNLLHAACNNSCGVSIFRLLQGQLTSETFDQLLAARNNNADTLLHCAARSRHSLVHKELLTGDIIAAQITAKNLVDETPLHLAVKLQQLKVAQLLLESAKLFGRLNVVNDQDLSGNTALHYAVQTGNCKLLKLLLDSGARIRLRNSVGKTAVDYCKSDETKRCFDDFSIETLIRTEAMPLQLNGIRKPNGIYIHPQNRSLVRIS